MEMGRNLYPLKQDQLDCIADFLRQSLFISVKVKNNQVVSMCTPRTYPYIVAYIYAYIVSHSEGYQKHAAAVFQGF